MEIKYIAKSIDDLPVIAGKIIPLFANYHIVAFYGAMGVGKTTFIKVLCSQMGVDDTVNSPSFSIINEYLLKDGRSVFHFDFYRLRNEEELFDLGYEDYFFGGEICFLEWPGKIENYLPEKRIDLYLEEQPDGSRMITLHCIE